MYTLETIKARVYENVFTLVFFLTYYSYSM